MNIHIQKLHTSQTGPRGFSLLEFAIALGILGLLMASLLPLQRAIDQRLGDMRIHSQFEMWMSHIEGFAITRRRLPCPAADTEGAELAAAHDGPCTRSTGWLPWRSMGLPRPQQAPRYAVASLETLGAPLAHTLTRTDGFRSVPNDMLSAAIFAPPDTTGSSPGALPALLVPDPSESVSGATSLATLPGLPCSGSRFLTVSAVAMVSTLSATEPLFEADARCFSVPEAMPAGEQFRWLSYERLMWLYLRTGLWGLP